ncbi:MAG: UDP-N-acetylglucosamine--N-acetylmuramyl-(pentapeptide) pyrophosphoryl-undecaprenol N-acetylglucosamine transferase [Candidatus Nanopelagicales bacterium]|nr:UDP-N-acetylglucosamine--N-acetylmuramyl-(pentapeptide) pyrophosphoryl-undecaprenol N-acetylglucosamine transferase [Candidatus Nanopelagicales bacterium]
MTRPTHVVLAAGGTAGHIAPALNLADALRIEEPAIQITVIGSERGLEQSLVPARGYPLITVPSVAMPRRLSSDLVTVGPRVRRASRLTAQHLRDLQTDVVVGFGGYASLPAYLAARRVGCSLVIHEGNAKPGLANRVGARFTKDVYVSVKGSLPGTPLGLPLDAAIAGLDRAAVRAQARTAFGLRPDGPVLLAFGGSQGAQRINEAIAQALPQLLDSGIQVLHAFGARNPVPAPAAGYIAVPFIERMDLAYAAADLGLTRAGGMTVAEVAAVGLPTVFVPLPIGNGEQRLNALGVVQAGGGVLIDNSQLTGAWLVDEVRSLILDPDRLVVMGEAAARVGVRDSSQRLAVEVLRIAHRHRSSTEGETP